MKKLIFLSCLILSIVSCKKDDPEEMKTTNDAVMEVEKNGTSYTITDFTNTLLSQPQGGQTGRRLDLRGDVDGGTLILSIANWDWQNPPENGILEKTYDTNEDFEVGPNAQCMDINGGTYCDTGLGTYLVSNSTTYTSEGIEDESFGSITIIENDPSEKTVSGNFDFTVIEFFTEEKITFKGTFSNLKY